MLLSLHIFGAVCTGILALLSIVAIRSRSKYLSGLRLGIIAIGLVQVISGTFLVIGSPEVSVARICLASMLYLGVLIGVEAALRKAIKAEATTLIRK